MYKDIISYQLAEGISEQQLLDVAGKIIDSWMKNQPGFIRWEIHKSDNDDGYTDIVYWETKEDAKQSEKNMVNIPNATEWFDCYKEGSIYSLNLRQVGTFK